MMETSIFGIGLAVIIFLLDVWAVASVWRSTKSAGTKWGWALVIFIFPLVGLGIWGIAGPRGIAIPPTSKSHSKG